MTSNSTIEIRHAVNILDITKTLESCMHMVACMETERAITINNYKLLTIII